ncbi:MAG: KdsC family phosphatase [Planctomycetota bacterium]|jgi:3-deoxy-D-manno-octulosonate 8-phosphate phosphatase (KDO 8-P phosphatase)
MSAPDPAAAIRVLLLDVDGVLTDGRLGYDDQDTVKRFDTRDGFAIKRALRAGLQVGVCSGRADGCVVRRIEELGMTPALLAVGDKVAAVDAWLAEAGYRWSQVAYVGDDLPDLGLVRRVGLGYAVADANHRLARRADRVTQAAGGSGAVAEVIDDLLRAQELAGDDRQDVDCHG